MGHKVTMKNIPRISEKTGKPLKTKPDLLVRCRSRGKTCLQERVSTKNDANILIENHRDDVFDLHRSNHPNDMMHVKKHDVPKASMVPDGVAAGTRKQQKSRMASRGKRGLVWFSNRSKGEGKD